jgi:hypothetical protein
MADERRELRGLSTMPTRRQASGSLAAKAGPLRLAMRVIPSFSAASLRLIATLTALVTSAGTTIAKVPLGPAQLTGDAVSRVFEGWRSVVPAGMNVPAGCGAFGQVRKRLSISVVSGHERLSP